LRTPFNLRDKTVCLICRETVSCCLRGMQDEKAFLNQAWQLWIKVIKAIAVLKATNKVETFK